MEVLVITVDPGLSGHDKGRVQASGPVDAHDVTLKRYKMGRC